MTEKPFRSEVRPPPPPPPEPRGASAPAAASEGPGRPAAPRPGGPHSHTCTECCFVCQVSPGRDRPPLPPSTGPPSVQVPSKCTGVQVPPTSVQRGTGRAARADGRPRPSRAALTPSSGRGLGARPLGRQRRPCERPRCVTTVTSSMLFVP